MFKQETLNRNIKYIKLNQKIIFFQLSKARNLNRSLMRSFHPWCSNISIFPFSIWMSHWHQQMVDSAEFWISCKWLKALRKTSQSQLIKCSAPSTICWCQCDIGIIIAVMKTNIFFLFSSPVITTALFFFLYSHVIDEVCLKVASHSVSLFTWHSAYR